MLSLGYLIGVNLISICSMCFKCLCNLNARFTSIFLKITLIPHLLLFCRIRRRIKQSEGRNQVKRKWLNYSSLILQGEGKASPRRGVSPRKRKGFTASEQRRGLRFAQAKTHLPTFAEANISFTEVKGELIIRQLSGLPKQRSLRLSEEHRAGAANFAFLAHLWPIFHYL